MDQIQGLEGIPTVEGIPVRGGKRNFSSETAQPYQRVTNRLSSKRSKTEKWIAVVLICGGLAAALATSFWHGVPLCFVGGCLYCHSRFLALWCDQG